MEHTEVLWCPTGRHEYTIESDHPLDPPFVRDCPIVDEHSED